MDLTEYRARHQAKYLEREEERKRLVAERQEKIKGLLEALDLGIVGMMGSLSASLIFRSLSSLFKLLTGRL